MKIIIKHLMWFHRPRVLSIIVSLLHFVWSLRQLYYTYMDFLDYYSEEDLQVEEDNIFDMPLEAVRYMLILFVLVLITTVMMFIGVLLKRPLFIACFILNTCIFIITFGIFAVCDVVDGFLEGQTTARIFREFMNDLTLIVVDFLTMYPVFLVFVELTEPLEASVNESRQSIEPQTNFRRNINVEKTKEGVAV